MGRVIPCAAAALLVLLTSRESDALSCASSTLVAPSVVEDAAGALQLARATNCSGGSFDVSWAGSYTLAETIHVFDGTSLSIAGTADGIYPSMVYGAGEVLLFEVDGGILNLSGLSLESGLGSDGGAILAIESVLDLDGCSFSGNNGGALHLVNSTFHVTESSFIDNFGPQGGAVFSAESTGTISDSTFTGNLASHEGSSDGGAIYSSESNVTISGSTFTANVASSEYGYSSEGGAIYCTDESTVTISDSNFTENSSPDGGGALRCRSSFVTISGYTVWEDNHAFDTGGGGGAIDVSWSTTRFTGNSTFSANSAIFGGAVHMASGTLDFSGSSNFIGNNGVRGGAFYFVNDDTLVSVNGMLYVANNVAQPSGGAIHLQGSTIRISGEAIFEGNQVLLEGVTYALEGGAIAAGGASAVEVVVGGSVLFSQNNADVGGGLYMDDSATFSVAGQATFTNNTAATGAGIGFTGDSSLSLIGENVSFSGNVASSSGGGIYAEGAAQLRVEGALFLSNFAGTTGGAMSIISIGDLEDPATVSTCSFTENQASDAGGAMLIAGGVVSVIGSDFNGNAAGRSGGAVVVSGAATLDGCTFVGNRAQIGSAVSNTVVVTLQGIEFSSNALLCDDDGLFLEWQNVSAYETACDSCYECNDCIIQNPNSSQVCEPVMDHTASLTGTGTVESLHLEPGYWRRSNTSREILECYRPDSCLGGTERICDAGYGGPFCAVCVEGYTVGLGYTCSKCSRSRQKLAIGLGVALFLAAIVAVALSVRYLGSSSSKPATDSVRSVLERTKVSQGLKILIVSWQIVSQFSLVAAVTYPEAYEAFVGYVDFIDLDLAWLLSADCWVDTDFYDTLLAATIGPLLVSGLVLGSFVLRVCGCPTTDLDRRSRIDRRHATFMYAISFLVYANVSSTVFRTFACDDLDNGTSFLRADHSIQCYTSKHQAFMAYAGFMCLVYPLGIPFCYAIVLRRVRDSLKSEEDDTRRANAPSLKALWAPYRRGVYYYEVVECLRRVTLSGVVVFILPNTAGQVITTFLLSLFFFALFTVLDPYTSAVDAWMARVGHAIVMMSMFVALVVKVDTEGDDHFSQDVFAGALVLVNCAMVLAVAMEAFGMCAVVLREIREPLSTTMLGS